jgi:hypothetical protein
MNHKYPPKFQGDGREKVTATVQPIGATSDYITKSQARMLTDMLYAKGSSVHSARGATLWVTLEAVHYNKTPYVMHHVPDLGWTITIKGIT